ATGLTRSKSLLTGSPVCNHSSPADTTEPVSNGLTRSKSLLTGSVVSAGLLWLHTGAHTARAVVAAAGTDSTGGAPQTLRHYRWVLTLRRAGGRWLVSDAALEGVPS